MFHLYNNLIAYPSVDIANGHHEIIDRNFEYSDLNRLFDVSKKCKHYQLFCTTDGYINLIINYIKQHLANCDSYNAYLLYKASIDSYNINNNFIKTNKNEWIDIVPYEQFLNYFASVSFEVDNSFNQISCLAVSNQYKIASFLSGQKKYNDNLVAIFKKCILRHCQDTIYELINVVLNNVYNIDGRSLDTDISNTSSDIVKMCFDNRLLKEFENYDYQNLVPKILNFVDWITKNSKLSSWLSLPDSDILNNKSFVKLLMMLQENDALNIIKYQLAVRNHYYGDVIFSYCEKPMVNDIILFEIYRRYLNGDQEQLIKWSLNE